MKERLWMLFSAHCICQQELIQGGSAGEVPPHLINSPPPPPPRPHQSNQISLPLLCYLLMSVPTSPPRNIESLNFPNILAGQIGWDGICSFGLILFLYFVKMTSQVIWSPPYIDIIAIGDNYVLLSHWYRLGGLQVYQQSFIDITSYIRSPDSS
jgi:hypothetical protein